MRVAALGQELVDLGLLAALQGVGLAAAGASSRGLGTKSTSRTQSDTELLATPSSVGDLLQRPRLGPQVAGPVLLGDEASISHARQHDEGV